MRTIFANNPPTCAARWITCVGLYFSNIAAVDAGSHKFASWFSASDSVSLYPPDGDRSPSMISVESHPQNDYSRILRLHPRAFERSLGNVRAPAPCGFVFPDAFPPRARARSHLGAREDPLFVGGLFVLDNLADGAPDEAATARDEDDLFRHRGAPGTGASPRARATFTAREDDARRDG